MDHKKLRIWTLFTQCLDFTPVISFYTNIEISDWTLGLLLKTGFTIEKMDLLLVNYGVLLRKPTMIPYWKLKRKSYWL